MSNYNPAGGGLQYRGTAASAPPNCTFSTVDPTQWDKNNVSLLDLWLNTTTNDVFILVSLAGTSSSRGSLATWVKLSTGAVGLFTLTGNSGGAIMPDGNGNINILGTGPITVTGDQTTFSETISIATATTTQIGATTLADNTITIAGSDTTHAVTPASLTAKLGVQTVNGVAYGTGTTMPIAWTIAGTAGQTLISQNSGVPAFGSITSPNATITVGYNSGSNSITLDVGGGSDTTVTTNDATPTTLKSVAVPNNQSITMYADIVAAKADYSAAIGGNVEATARRAGGSLTLVGAPVVNLNTDSGGSPDLNIVVSGNNFILQVTGEAATTYNWKALVRTVTV
jgi:putative hemolysin